MSLKYLFEDTDRHGNVRVYFRRRKGARRVRIRETPGTEEFMAAYRAALDGYEPPPSLAAASLPAAGSLHWLVGSYCQSAEFGQLAEDTRRVRRRILDGLCKIDGGYPANLVKSVHVRDWRDDKADAPEAANSRVKALRQVFKWAVDVGYLDSNPARDVPYLKPRNRDGHHTWTIEEVRRFEARHPIGAKARLAMALLLYTGVRRSDVVLLGPQMERDGWLHFTVTKGKREHQVPILPVLRDVLDRSPSGHLSYLVTAYGKPYSSGGFGNWFRGRCDEAGLLHCTAHGLRKAGATRAAENGATEHELMAIYGWESPKQAALYTRKANRKKLAGTAMSKLTENKSSPLSAADQAGGEIRGKKSL